MNITLIQGGSSPEREISLRTSTAIASAIKQLNHQLVSIDPADFAQIEDFISHIRSHKPDLVFIGLHGGQGEDGTLQALLSVAHIPFTGSHHLASAIAMDKNLSTIIAKSIGIPVPQTQIISAGYSLSDIHIPIPVVVKPNSAGSSVGTHIIHQQSLLANAIDDALLYDKQVLIQEFIAGREFSVSVLGDDVLPPIEIKPLTSFYDYTNKYNKGKTEYICPAPLNHTQTQTIRKYTYDVFSALGCKIYGRVDFILRSEVKEDFYFLEVNTLPGMTELSLVPMAAKTVGVDFVNLVDKIIKMSVEDSGNRPV